MEKTTKIIITVVSVIVFLVLFAVVVGVTQSRGGGIIGLMLVAGLIGGLKAVWKKEDNDNHPVK